MRGRALAGTRPDQVSSSGLSHRDAILTILVILGVVNILHTLNAVAAGHGPTISDIPAEIVMHALLCLMGYLVYLVIRAVDRLPVVPRLALIFVACVIAGAFFSPIIHGVQYVMVPENGLKPLPVLTFRRIQVGTIPYLFTAAGLLAVDFYRKVREREDQLQRSQALLRDAQLLALRYQIDPHFLFNALNSISTLVLLRRNEAAEGMLLRLSDFFRHTLDVGSSETIPLAQELELQQAYLNVEQVRFGDALSLEIDVPSELMDEPVPPLVLQPLVENAVKHGSRCGVIAIKARPHEAGIVLTVVNSVADPGSEGGAVGTGTGIRNVRDRLNSAYGAGAALQIGLSDEGVYHARLLLPRVAGRGAASPADLRMAGPDRKRVLGTG